MMGSSSVFASLGAALQSFSSPRFSFRAAASLTPKADPGLTAFETELSSRLEQLKSTDDLVYLSIPWLCEAMEVVLSTHASAEMFVPELRQALVSGDVRWLDDYLDNSIKLLDICIALKEVISDMKSYNTHLQLAVRALERGPIGEPQLRRCKKELEKCTDALKRKEDSVNQCGQRRSKLENCSSMLRRMGDRLNTEDAAKGNFFMVIYAAQVSTIFICGLMSSALSFKSKRPLSSIYVGGQSPWSFTLSSLQQKVKEQVEKSKSRDANTLLKELDRSDIAVQTLHKRVDQLLDPIFFPLEKEQASEIKTSVGSLRVCSNELCQGLSSLEAHLEDVYKTLLTSRMVLLDMYSNS